MLRIKTVLQGRASLRTTGGSDVLLRVSLLGAGCAGLRSSNSWSYFVNRSWFSKATLNKNELGRGPTLAVISSCLLLGWEGRQTAERSLSLGSEDRYLARVSSQKKPQNSISHPRHTFLVATPCIVTRNIPFYSLIIPLSFIGYIFVLRIAFWQQRAGGRKISKNARGKQKLFVKVFFKYFQANISRHA